ncbi:rCG26823 [Rattus norvegicus]|uniref:RCG26823 n=1 Tax=Rattus norvegicus TaxID=10116 RepID=A6HMD1_RAT|nr:rCG26823 [Rattus norvegicus]
MATTVSCFGLQCSLPNRGQRDTPWRLPLGSHAELDQALESS